MVVPGRDTWFLFLALGVIVVGNGLFQGQRRQPGAQDLAEGDDSKIDSAFTIYYMAVNLGAMISPTRDAGHQGLRQQPLPQRHGLARLRRVRGRPHCSAC